VRLADRPAWSNASNRWKLVLHTQDNKGARLARLPDGLTTVPGRGWRGHRAGCGHSFSLWFRRPIPSPEANGLARLERELRQGFGAPGWLNPRWIEGDEGPRLQGRIRAGRQPRLPVLPITPAPAGPGLEFMEPSASNGCSQRDTLEVPTPGPNPGHSARHGRTAALTAHTGLLAREPGGTNWSTCAVGAQQ